MPTARRLFTTALLLALSACATDEHPSNGTAAADPEASFASYAQEFYRELEDSALSDSPPIDIGMFGDLSVMAGENVVMGRYRYRVDNVGGDVSGYLTFFARSPDNGEAIPIILVFDEENGSWTLREATYVPASADGAPALAVEEVLDRRLNAWARRAAGSVTTRTP